MGYEFGNEYQIIDENGIPNHRTNQQSLREDHEGDVGIFEIYKSRIDAYAGQYPFYEAEVQIAVVTKNGDIKEASDYLLDTFKNIKKNKESEHYRMELVKFINLKPLGKNSAGLQTVVLNIYLNYITDIE